MGRQNYNSDDEEVSSTQQAPDDTHDERAIPFDRQNPLSISSVYPRVLEWIVNARRQILRCQGSSHELPLRELRSLQHIEECLTLDSSMGKAPSYTIEATARLWLSSDDDHQRLPLLLRDINVIHVCLRADIDFPADNSSVIRSSFDILPCAIEVRVAADLKYECNATQAAFAALEARQLVLRPCAFASQAERLNTQMIRLLKYVQRGFILEIGAWSLHTFTMLRSCLVLRTTPAPLPDIESDIDSSSARSAGTPVSHAQRARRVDAAWRGYHEYDYWALCPDGRQGALDPIRNHFAELQHGSPR